MYYLTTEHSMDAAHFLAGYDGKCGNIHGHRWRVVVSVESKTIQEKGSKRGMIVDFGDLKKDVKSEVDFFDHCFIVEEGTLQNVTVAALMNEGFKLEFVDFRPTAECFSRYFFDRIKGLGYKVHEVQVYETPNNCATYREGKDE